MCSLDTDVQMMVDGTCHECGSDNLPDDPDEILCVACIASKKEPEYSSDINFMPNGQVTY